MPTDDRDTEPRDPSPPTDDGGGVTAEVDVMRRVPARPGFRISATAIGGKPGATRYERGRELGRGGLGRVSAALDKTLQREVAIKELHQRTERGLRRFARESLTTARLQHPAIVPVLDAGTWESGDPYLVMKLLEGKTLGEELRTRTTTEARLALLPNLLTVADALGYAHAQGVVHRDVKPANVMIGKHGETVLLDWGVAHDASATELETKLERGQEEPQATHERIDPLTVAGALAGTIRYMSPEQACGHPAVPAFDVYSLGVTIATVLSGRVPYRDLDHDAILERLRTNATEVPTLPAETPADLAAIVAKATSAPATRYEHAGQLADDLRKFIAGQLVSARRYTARQLVTRWIGRNRLLVVTAGVATGAIAVIAVVALTSVVHERNLAVTEREEAVARARELVLLQARASLRTDPTATIAWLEDYPATAPHQDEVLAMVDEAAGRGVARHVWHAASEPTDVDFAGDGRSLVSAHRDGELVGAALDTGARQRLAKLDVPILFARASGAAIAILDQDGGLSRWTAAGITHDATFRFPSRPTGLYRSGAGDLKVTFVDGDAVYTSKATRPALGDYAFVDDESDASALYVVSATGELSILDPTPRRLWSFAPHAWVKGSSDGKAYVALVPGDDITVWVGTAAGGPPVEVGKTRPCVVGQDEEQSSVVANDARVVAIKRCGVLLVYSVTARRPITIGNPDRVGLFELSPDARWLALGRSGGIELLDLQTGASRELAGGATISQARFSQDGRWLVSVGVEQGVRVWPLEPGSHAGRLDDIVAPTRLYVPARGGELAIRRHLGCARWATSERRITASFGVADSAIRGLDDERALWAWDGSDDGTTCIFAGQNGSALVVGTDGVTHALTDAHALEACVLTGVAAVCRTDADTLVTFDVASGRSTARAIDGAVRGLVHFRNSPMVLVQRSTGCALERPAGDLIAKLPGGTDCRSARASNATQLGHEAGVVVTRTGAVDVWTEHAGVLTIATEHGVVEVSRELGLVAVARDRLIEIWDLQTRARRTVPVGHALAIGLLAWSSTGILASADGETVRLWDPRTERARVIYAPHVLALAWAADGASLFTTDGRVVEQLATAELARGSTPAEVRQRLDALTSARIVDGRAVTP